MKLVQINKLSFDIDKTNFMIFKNKYNNKPMPNFETEIDNNANFKIQIRNKSIVQTSQ